MRKILSILFLILVFILLNMSTLEIHNLFYDSWFSLLQGVFVFFIALVILLLEDSLKSFEKNNIKILMYFNFILIGYISGHFAPMDSLFNESFEFYMILWWGIPIILGILYIKFEDKLSTNNDVALSISTLLLILEIIGIPLLSFYLSYL